MFTSVVGFINRNANRFPKSSSKVFKELEAKVTTLSAESTERISAETAEREARLARIAAFESLYNDLNRVARLTSALHTELLELPARRNNADLLHCGRAFLETAPAMEKDLLEHGFPANFVTELETKIGNLERSIGEHVEARKRRSESIHRWDVLAAEALEVLARFDVVVENALAGDPVALESYKSSRTIRRPAARKEDTATTAVETTTAPADPAPIANTAVA
jgi:hypothetical protein